MTTRTLTAADFDAFEDAMMAISPYQRKQEAIAGFASVKNTRPTFTSSTRKGRAEMLYGRKADQANAVSEYAAWMAFQGL